MVGVVEDFTTWVGILVQLPDGRHGVVRTAQHDGSCTVQVGTFAQETGFAPGGAWLGV